jgi:urease subunit gamma/beta
LLVPTLPPQNLPGERKRVRLVALAGERIVYGGNGLIDGTLDDAGKKQQALEKIL